MGVVGVVGLVATWLALGVVVMWPISKMMAKLGRDAGRPSRAEARRQLEALRRDYGIGVLPIVVVFVVAAVVAYGLVVLGLHG